MGPNFSNLDIPSYVGRHPYEINASWVVLQAMRMTWEKKVREEGEGERDKEEVLNRAANTTIRGQSPLRQLRDAQFYETTPREKSRTTTWLSSGDPGRFDTDSKKKFYGAEDTARMTGWAQKMATSIADFEELQGKLLPEIRFISTAIGLETGTEIRKYAYDFVDKEGEVPGPSRFATNSTALPASLTPRFARRSLAGLTMEALSEGVKRFAILCDNMQPDPYGPFSRLIAELSSALDSGSGREVTLYDRILYGPEGAFETYDFEAESEFSMLRFLDNEVDVQEGGVGPLDEVMRQFGFGAVVDAVGKGKGNNRKKDLGWLDALGEDGVGKLERGVGGYVEDDEEEEERGEGRVVDELEFEEEEGAVGGEGVFVPNDIEMEVES